MRTAFLDTLYGLTEQLGRLLPEWASLCFELGDTMAGSGGAGGDYNADGLRAGQPKFRQGYVRNDRPNRPPQQTTKYDRSSGRRAPGGQPYADYFKGGSPGGAGWLGKLFSTCVLPVTGQRISTRLIEVACPRPISCRNGLAPKLPPEPTVR